MEQRQDRDGANNGGAKITIRLQRLTLRWGIITVSGPGMTEGDFDRALHAAMNAFDSYPERSEVAVLGEWEEEIPSDGSARPGRIHGEPLRVIPERVERAVRAVVEYLRDDERRDFEEGPGSGHIFEAVSAVDDWLADNPPPDARPKDDPF